MKNNQLITSILILFVIILSACTRKEPEYVICGTIKPVTDGELIMLFKFRGDSVYSVDTTIIKLGAFQFTGKECLDDIAIVTTGNYPGIVRSANVVLEQGKISLELDSVSKVSGTPLNDLLTHQIQQKWNKDEMIEFCKSNTSNPVGRRIFKDNSNNIQNEQIYEIATLIPAQYRSDPEIAGLIEKRKKQDEISQQREQLNGSKYIDFELITPDKELKKLSDYVGHYKYVYLEFWSSYCGPCIADIPNLKKAYENHHHKGFQLISFSLDTEMERWHNVIKDVDAPWIHLSDLKGDQSPVKKAYYITGIPSGILIDKEGVILAVNLPGIILDQFLDKLFEK